MDSTVTARELEAVRQRRAELRDTLDALEASLSGELRPALERLAREFALHVEVTEGPGGLHQAILAGDLRLANQVDTLAAEHAVIAAEIAALVRDPDVASTRALIARIERHRRRGADLIHEAFATDIGGGD